MQLTLTLLNGETIKYTTEENTVTLGRSSKCTVHIPHEGMSRMHCQIEVINGEIYITDLESTNGVYIDNIRIPPSKRVPYSTFLPLSFGAVTGLQLELPAGPAPKQGMRGSSVEASPVIKKEQKKETHPRKKRESTKFWAINVIILVAVLFLAGLWYTDERVKMPEYYYESADEIPTTYLNQ